MTSNDVFVAGAGPSGLALALQAASLGAAVRIIERRDHTFRPSRAIITHPRTLELLRPLGVTEAILAAGRPAPAVNLRLGRRRVATTLGPFAVNDTAFPYLAFVPQAVVERQLTTALADHGVEVERGVELVELEQRASGVTAVVARPDGRTETTESRFLIGCDGADSTVRAATGIAWPGTTYRHEIVLADLELDGRLDETVAHASAGPGGVVFLLALREQATWRLLASRGRSGSASSEPVEATVIEAMVQDCGVGATVSDIAWSAAIPLQHRLAARYRSGKIFLVGDAAHTHSPAGGQGMNTGIQDALNLAWKLAFASRMSPGDPGTEALLDSYEVERRAVARRMLAATRLLFWLEAGTDPAARFVRSILAPMLAPLALVVLGRDRLIATAVRSLSQLGISYRTGIGRLLPSGTPDLSSLRPGDRLPDVAVTSDGGRTLHEVTARPGVHVLLARSAPTLDTVPSNPWVHVHRILSWPGVGTAGVRPDGHVGHTSRPADASAVADWLRSIGLTPTPDPTSRPTTHRP
jgi:2-polyprenyl-6-methoxyphenol hydroxylase-like FAD-dependent oxidoreductase